jgi:hypothetical protein
MISPDAKPMTVSFAAKAGIEPCEEKSHQLSVVCTFIVPVFGKKHVTV